MGRNVNKMLDDFPGVSAFRDRHGKWRYRFRKKGVSGYLASNFGSAGFKEEYEGFMAQINTKGLPISRQKVVRGSIDDLCVRLYASNDFGGNATTKARNRRIIERFRNSTGKDGKRTGSVRAFDTPFTYLDRYISELSENRVMARAGLVQRTRHESS